MKKSIAKGPTDRLQKVLAQTGAGSRRQIEDWIREGKISVNGRVAELGQQVTANCRIMLDGKSIRIKPEKNMRVLAYHKPTGQICSRSDPGKRPTVFENLPKLRNGRWISIGRLDFNTSGLLLFTTDGMLANKLTHPSSEIDREYRCRVQGEVDKDFLRDLRQGIDLDGKKARFESVDYEGGEGTNRWYRVVIREGRYREVRRMWEAGGYRVSRLLRVRYGPIVLSRTLKSGNYMNLEPDMVRKLLTANKDEDRKVRETPPPKKTGKKRGGKK
ncbi:MAG: 23S rRNA pseudouridine2605 synthase [Parasphingorhabdus sp.]|jgi:23S rRNA pseudouridine2605 synthase